MTDFIEAKGATLAAQVTGSGPAVVLIHGLGTDMSSFDELTSRLPDHRVIRYDLRGHGKSSVPDGPYSMGGLIADAEAVMDLELQQTAYEAALAAFAQSSQTSLLDFLG